MNSYVGGKAAPIKGDADLDWTKLPETRLRSPEQLIGGASVGFGFGHVRFNAGNLTFKHCDPLFELGHRQRPQLLFARQGQRIDRPRGKEVVLIHAAQR